MRFITILDCVASVSAPPFSPDWLSLSLRSLGFVILLGVVGYAISRLGKSKLTPKSKDERSKGRILISDSRPLGNRQFIVVAEYGSHKHLLGISPGKIEHLAKLEGTPMIDKSVSPDQSL